MSRAMSVVQYVLLNTQISHCTMTLDLSLHSRFYHFLAKQDHHSTTRTNSIIAYTIEDANCGQPKSEICSRLSVLQRR